MNRFRLCLNFLLNAGASPISQLLDIHYSHFIMEHADVNSSGNADVEPKISKNVSAEENQIANSIMDGKSHMESSHEVHIPSEESFCPEENNGSETLDKGYLKFGYGFLPLGVNLLW